MQNLAFGFAPPDYGDWTTYAGFNRKTGEQEGSRLAGALGVSPPSSLEEFGATAVKPYEEKFNQLQTAFGQATGGNLGQAYSTLKQKPTATQSTGFDFSTSPFSGGQ
jgi:hypothetical protein